MQVVFDRAIGGHDPFSPASMRAIGAVTVSGAVDARVPSGYCHTWALVSWSDGGRDPHLVAPTVPARYAANQAPVGAPYRCY
jgi:hypothetical protein